jgi:hypothetical protein
MRFNNLFILLVIKEQNYLEKNLKIYVQDKNEDFVDNSFNKFAFNLSNCLL